MFEYAHADHCFAEYSADGAHVLPVCHENMQPGHPGGGDYSYANAVTWPSGQGPYASRNVQIIFNIDRNAFWTFVTDLYGARF